jgi:porphobilinogen deaminase
MAMVQARETAAVLCAAHGWADGAVEIVPVTASGDKVLTARWPTLAARRCGQGTGPVAA